MREMVQEVAEEQVLAGFLQSDHRVELGRRLVGQHRPQEGDVRRRHLHIDQEVRAVCREQDRELGLAHEQRVEIQPSLAVVLHRDDEGIRIDAVDDAPDEVRRLVADEGRRQHLDLMIRLEHERPRETLAERGEHVREIVPEVGEAPLESEVEHDVDQGGAQALLHRVVAPVRRRVGVDVLGGDRRAHEDELVVKVRAMQDLDRHRVEERLRALGLLVVDQERDELALDFAPHRIAVNSRGAQLALKPVGGLLHPPVVEVDAVAADVLDREPVAGVEMPSRRARALAEQRVVLVEAFDQGARDRAGLSRDALCAGGGGFDGGCH